MYGVAGVYIPTLSLAIAQQFADTTSANLHGSPPPPLPPPARRLMPLKAAAHPDLISPRRLLGDRPLHGQRKTVVRIRSPPPASTRVAYPTVPKPTSPRRPSPATPSCAQSAAARSGITGKQAIGARWSRTRRRAAAGSIIRRRSRTRRESSRSRRTICSCRHSARRHAPPPATTSARPMSSRAARLGESTTATLCPFPHPTPCHTHARTHARTHCS